MMKTMMMVMITPTSVKAGMLVDDDEDDDVDDNDHDDGNNHTDFSEGLYAAQRLARPFITHAVLVKMRHSGFRRPLHVDVTPCQ